MTEHTPEQVADLIDEARKWASSSPLGKITAREVDRGILFARRLADTLETVSAERDAAVRRAQAEDEVRALRDAADEIKATFDDYDRRRPLHPKAEVSTDYVNDAQWAELIVRNRADRIEQEVEHE